MKWSLTSATRMLGFVLALSLATTIKSAAETQTSQAWDPYITATELGSLIQYNPDVQVIDIRHKKYLKKGSIPGAVWMTFKEWRGPKDRPGQPPEEEALEALLGAHGLDPSKPIVIHNHSGRTIQTGRAAIVYWLLKSSGAEQVAILNGGFKAWAAAALPKATGSTKLDPTTVDIDYRYDWWADPIDIFGVASGQSEGAILDARLDAQVKKSMKTGKPMQSMPMARYIPASFFTNNLSAKNMSRSGQDEFIAGLEARGIDLGDGFLISVCQTGELSALSWFYASEIVGIDNVLYYPDALQGWQSDGGLMFGMKHS